MTGEAGTLINAQGLEEHVVRGEGGATGLKGGDLATRVFVRTEPGDNFWRWLRTMIGILVLTHLLRVLDGSRRPF
jgi:hypothetical protein